MAHFKNNKKNKNFKPFAFLVSSSDRVISQKPKNNININYIRLSINYEYLTDNFYKSTKNV